MHIKGKTKRQVDTVQFGGEYETKRQGYYSKILLTLQKHPEVVHNIIKGFIVIIDNNRPTVSLKSFLGLTNYSCFGSSSV